MRYYNKRFDLKQPKQAAVGITAVPFWELERRVSEEIRGAHGSGKVDSLLQRVRDGAIIVNKNRAEKTVTAYGVPLIYKELFRELFPEFTISFT